MLPGIRFHSFANGYCTNRSTIRGADGRLCDNELLAPLESPAGENIASTRAPHAVQKTKCTIALAILRSVGSSHVSIPPLMKLPYMIPERPWLSKLHIDSSNMYLKWRVASSQSRTMGGVLV